jgi:hypothetical protein
MDREYELVSAFADRFIQGGSFATIVSARERASKILDTSVLPGTAIAKLVDESVERGLVRAAKIIATAQLDPRQAYARLVDLYQRQPTLVRALVPVSLNKHTALPFRSRIWRQC